MPPVCDWSARKCLTIGHIPFYYDQSMCSSNWGSGPKKAPKSHMALYGNVAIPRAYCNSCKSMAMIISGEFGCCGKKLEDEISREAKRMSHPPGWREKPSRAEQARILSEQSNVCLYCEMRFGRSVWSAAGKEIVLRVEWDHLIPFSYAQNNKVGNFCAACHICNRLKGALMFQTLEEARIHVTQKWEEKGYRTKMPTMRQPLQYDTQP